MASSSPPRTPTQELDHDTPPPRPSKPSSSVRTATAPPLRPADASPQDPPVLAKRLFDDSEGSPSLSPLPAAMQGGDADGDFLARESPSVLARSPTSAFQSAVAAATLASPQPANFSFDSAFDPLEESPTHQLFSASLQATSAFISSPAPHEAPAAAVAMDTAKPAARASSSVFEMDDDLAFLAPAQPLGPFVPHNADEEPPDQTAVLNRELLLSAANASIPAHFFAAGIQNGLLLAPTNALLDQGRGETDNSSHDSDADADADERHEGHEDYENSLHFTGNGDAHRARHDAEEVDAAEDEQDAGFTPLVEHSAAVAEAAVAVVAEEAFPAVARSATAPAAAKVEEPQGVKRKFEDGEENDDHGEESEFGFTAKHAATAAAIVSGEEDRESFLVPASLDVPPLSAPSELEEPLPAQPAAAKEEVHPHPVFGNSEDSFADHGSFVAAPSLDVPSLAAEETFVAEEQPGKVTAKQAEEAPKQQGDDEDFGDFSSTPVVAATPPAAPAVSHPSAAASDDFDDDFGDFSSSPTPAAASKSTAAVADDFGDFEEADMSVASISAAAPSPTVAPSPGQRSIVTIPIDLPSEGAAADTPAVPLSQQWVDGTLFGPTRCKACNAPTRTTVCLACGDRQGALPVLATSTAKVDETLERVIEWNTKCVDDPNSLPLVGLESDSALRLLLAEADLPPPSKPAKPPQLSPRTQGSAFLIV